ncbi:hypothetical protein H4J58_09790 [Colwellia sp. MB3u-70]|uniref:hypothetical protein n=1 Tax=unclassified Colwellia TaxID=196834 RepID=UPI0015F6BAB5|nr:MULTISPECIES: hypothetical protein [unclassified Colwellia]MBA6292609.1 hypothetical protein [Colwellia sp. MB3u-8]MBA6307404.1 hypothetical protein [Colwellia sp. MB3u-70]
MILLFIGVLSVVFSMFFYCQAISSGLGIKRWAIAGLMFGPFVWPMFCMKKRVKIYQRFGFDCLLFPA